eukprot:2468688-Rhodomonas_salina.2
MISAIMISKRRQHPHVARAHPAFSESGAAAQATALACWGGVPVYPPQPLASVRSPVANP